MDEDKLPEWEPVELKPYDAKSTCQDCPYAKVIKQIQRDTAQIKKKINRIAKSNN